MNTYAAFLGNQPDISLAELQCVIPDLTITNRIRDNIAIVSTNETLKAKHLTHCGGLFLLAEHLPTAKTLADVPSALLSEVESVKGKVTFSLRAYGVDKKIVHGMYRDVKRALKQKNIPTRYIGNENKPPVSAQLHDEDIVSGKKGCEIVLLGGDDDFLWIGKTIAAQDPDSYTKRDMEKPVRDTRAGLLPPKLAQILLNFGLYAAREVNPKQKEPLTVYDPFCGTGVIPVEAVLRGWNILASDNSQKAVNGCETNIEWIRKEEKILKKDVSSTIWKHDATKPFDLKNHPTVIVTETMLGPALSDRPTAKDAAKYKTECDNLEIAFLENVTKTLPGVPVVAMFPVWYIKSGPLKLEKVWKKIEEIGFIPTLPEGAPHADDKQPSLIYRRSDQTVGREIVVLIPKK